MVATKSKETDLERVEVEVTNRIDTQECKGDRESDTGQDIVEEEEDEGKGSEDATLCGSASEDGYTHEELLAKEGMHELGEPAAAKKCRCGSVVGKQDEKKKQNEQISQSQLKEGEPTKTKKHNQNCEHTAHAVPAFTAVTWKLGENSRLSTQLLAVDTSKSQLELKKSKLKKLYAGTVPGVNRVTKRLLNVQQPTKPMKTGEGVALETEDWDEVDEVWARAEKEAKERGGSVLDIRVLERVIIEMDEEMGVDWKAFSS